MCDLIYQSIYLLMYLPTNSITSIMKCFRNFEQISYYPFWKPEIYNPNKAWVFATLTSYQCLTFVLQKRPCLRPIRRELQSKLNATTTKPQENSYILAKKLMKNREVPILSPPDPYFDVFDLGINTHIAVYCNWTKI